VVLPEGTGGAAPRAPSLVTTKPSRDGPHADARDLPPDLRTTWRRHWTVPRAAARIGAAFVTPDRRRSGSPGSLVPRSRRPRCSRRGSPHAPPARRAPFSSLTDSLPIHHKNPPESVTSVLQVSAPVSGSSGHNFGEDVVNAEGKADTLEDLLLTSFSTAYNPAICRTFARSREVCNKHSYNRRPELRIKRLQSPQTKGISRASRAPPRR
jgi:hypothetical protein